MVVPVLGDLPAETDLDHILVTGDQPALGRAAPVVGDLGLLAVPELLLENAQLIADGITDPLHAEGSHAVHVAGGQSAQTAVSEPGIRLRLKDIGSAEAEILQGADQGITDPEVEGVLHQAAADEKLHGHIVDFLLLPVRIFYGQEAAHHLTDDDGRGLKNLRLGGVVGRNTEMRAQLVGNGAADFVTGNLTKHMK